MARLTRAQIAEREAKLSTRAKKVLARLRAGEWYPVYSIHGLSGPKAMAELLEAGLAQTGGRAQTFVACYLPLDYAGISEFQLTDVPNWVLLEKRKQTKALLRRIDRERLRRTDGYQPQGI